MSDYGYTDPADDPLNADAPGDAEATDAELAQGGWTGTDQSSSSSGFDWSGLEHLVATGIQAFRPSSPSATGTSPSSTGSSAPSSSGSSSSTPARPGFDWSQLSNFSTPYPYAAGLVSLLVLSMMMRK